MDIKACRLFTFWPGEMDIFQLYFNNMFPYYYYYYYYYY